MAHTGFYSPPIVGTFSRMMDLPPIAQVILVYAALGFGVIVTLLTGFVQVKELGRAWSGGSNAALVRRGFLAASVGMGSVGGSILALELGGPGAIVWMWVASLLGMALIYAEVMLSIRYRRRDPVSGRVRAGIVHALEHGIGTWWSRTLAVLFALAFVVFALAAGSVLQVQQSGLLLGTAGADRWLVAGFLVMATAVGLLVPKLREFVVALGPVAVALYVLATILIIARAPGSAGAALSSMFAGAAGTSDQLASGAAGASFQLVLQAGVLRAVLATEAGLGSAGFTPQADRARDGAKAASAAMLAPLVSGILVPTLTALAVLTAAPWAGLRVDEPGERVPVEEGPELSDVELADLAGAFAEGDVEALSQFDRTRTQAMWAPLERPQSRGTAASLQAGQTLVLPKDAVSEEGAGLLEDHIYPLVMRANPRGMRLSIGEGENAIILARAPETEGIKEIVYRDRDPERSKHAAFDLRVPVETDIVGPEGGMQYVRMRPASDEHNLSRLAKTRDGPYVVFADYKFDARVVQMFQKKWGMHHALVEVEAPDADQFPRPVQLRTAVTGGGFRGPYFDNNEARGPMAMVTREGFEAPVGARMRLEYRTPARGIEIGRLLASGEIVAPPWRFLAETTHAIIRHDTDPSQDRLVRVEGKLVDGTLRFLNKDTHVAKFTQVDIWDGYSGVYLLPPNYSFEVEVHSGVRFPASNSYLQRAGLDRNSVSGPLSDRRTLVAVSDYPEPEGSRGELYDPHPAEVMAWMEGPWVASDASERLGWAAALSAKPGVLMLLSFAILILTLTTMIAWAGYGARAADYLLGHGGGVGFCLVFLVMGLAGTSVDTLQVLRVADFSMIALVVLNGLGLTLLLIDRKHHRVLEDSVRDLDALSDHARSYRPAGQLD